MDIERDIRAAVVERLSLACECQQHVYVKHPILGRVQTDVLCRPRDLALNDLSFAIEVKIHQRIGDKELGPWIKQAADYVGAFPENLWPKVVCSFIWLVGVGLNENEERSIFGMIQLAQHFRVGHAWERLPKRSLNLTFGPSADVYRESSGGWTAAAQTLLMAKRQTAGTRKRL